METKNKNVKKSAVEKRRETILKKREVKAQKKQAYHIKREDKYILNAGYAYSQEKKAPVKVERVERNFHMLAEVEYNISYKQKKGKYVTNKHIVNESFVIKAHTLAEAKDKMMEEVKSIYESDDSWKNYELLRVEYKSVLKMSEPQVKTEVKKIRMKDIATRILDYDYIKEYQGFLQTDKDYGTCVIDNFVGMYGNKLHITRNDLIERISNFYNQKYYNIWSELAFHYNALDYDNDNDEWTIEDGVDAECLQNICQFYDISHYCYDVTNQCVLKYVSKSRNNESLCYFCINEHMYLIKDKDLKLKMAMRAKNKEEKNIKSSLFENPFETTNIYSKFKLHKNIPVDEIKKYNETSIFIYTRNGQADLNDIFQQFIKTYNLVPSNIKATNHKISYFEATINGVKHYVVLDPNEADRGIDFKTVKSLCKDNNIEFKNQSFVGFINQMKDQFFNNLSERFKFDVKFRDQLFKSCKGKCEECKNKLVDGEFQIDHIRPLANGGTNDVENLQLLCLSCHADKCDSERENGVYKRISDTHSSFNSEVKKIMVSDLAKSYAFIERINENPDNKKVYHIDKNKCRRNLLYYGEYDYPVFTCMDNVEKYCGQTGAGIYCIETKNKDLFSGNGWYYYPVVDFALKQSIIEPAQIKYAVIASLTIPCNYYNDFIDHCEKKLGNLSKLSINSMIGNFNYNIEKNKISKTLGIVKNSYDAYYDYFSLNDNKAFIYAFDCNGENLYHIYKDIIQENTETESPLYHQIVQMENIEMYKLKKLIESKGGVVLDLNTDACSCIFPDDVLPLELIDDENIKGYYYDKNQEFPKYKIEIKDRLKHESCKNMMRTDTYQPPKIYWNNYKDVEDNNFEPLIDKLFEDVFDENESLHIEGPPGYGKSYLVKQIQKKLDEQNKKYISLGPTNISILNLEDDEALTLDRLMNKFKKKSNIMNLNIDFVFVDEVSMMKEIFYKFLLTLKKLKPQVKFIISGDYEQLLPVGDRFDFDYSNSYALYELCSGNKLSLTKYRRGDKALGDICMKVRAGEDIDTSIFGDKKTKFNLCFTNKKRMAINKKYMDKANEFNDGLKLDKVKGNANSQDVILHEKTPIMAYKNNTKLDIVNNERFVIDDICKDTIYFSNDKKKNLSINISEFQKNFYVAYASTIHKSQAATFDFPYTIHEWHKLDKRLKYVAISRATKLKNVNIII